MESDQLAAASIQGNLRLLGDNSPRGRVTATDALKFMDAAQRHWDVVFVDPPFDLGIGTSALEYLASHDCLNHDSWIYFETRRSAPEAVPDSLYTLHREKTAGDVLYRLLTPKAQQ